MILQYFGEKEDNPQSSSGAIPTAKSFQVRQGQDLSIPPLTPPFVPLRHSLPYPFSYPLSSSLTPLPRLPLLIPSHPPLLIPFSPPLSPPLSTPQSARARDRRDRDGPRAHGRIRRHPPRQRPRPHDYTSHPATVPGRPSRPRDCNQTTHRHVPKRGAASDGDQQCPRCTQQEQHVSSDRTPDDTLDDATRIRR